MKRTIGVIGCIVFLLIFTTPASADMVFEGTIEQHTTAVFLGKTHVIGDFDGYPVEHLLNTSQIHNLNAFPLIGESTIDNLQDITLIENIQLDSFNDIDDIIQSMNNLTTTFFHQVTIQMEEGLFPLVSSDLTIQCDVEIPYAISGFFPFNLNNDDSIPLLFLTTTTPLNLHYRGALGFLTQQTSTGHIILKESDGSIIWSGDLTNNLIIIHDNAFIITQHPPLGLVPLNTKSSSPSITLAISPSATTPPLDKLLNNLTDTLTVFGEEADFSEQVNNFEGISSLASNVLNGAIIFINSNQTVTIDKSQQTISSFGFARVNRFDITIPSDPAPEPHMRGNCRLAFLGTHFYNSAAKETSNGVAFPLLLLIVWIIAIMLFFYIRFYVKTPVQSLSKNTKRLALIFHLITIPVAFLLMDLHIANIFGISALTNIFGGGVLAFSVIFLLFEAILWLLGYVLFAIPVRMVTNSLLRFVGFGKDAKGIGKGVGMLSIWLFTVLYALLLINIVLSFVDFGGMFALG